MPEPENTFENTFQVLPHHLDHNWRITPEALCHLALDTAGKHAHKLGLSVSRLTDEGLTWMLSRFKVSIDNMPKGGETFTIKTWPAGIEKLFAYRNFEVKNGDGVVIGSAITSWLMIDLEKRRPVRPQSHFEGLEIFNISREGYESLGKLPGIDKTESADERLFTVLNRDIDMNNHVTSVSYISWLLETVPHEFHTDGSMREIEINYLAETFYGETVLARTVREDAANGLAVFRHALFCAEDDRELTRARTVWSLRGAL